jgi:hypothetical protein
MLLIGYALKKERCWVILNMVGMSVAMVSDVGALVTPDAELLRPGLAEFTVAWRFFTLVVLFVMFIVNGTWLLVISAHDSKLARRWAFGTWAYVCCAWLILVVAYPLLSYFGSGMISADG